MNRIALALFVLLAACGERVVYVYPDGSVPTDAPTLPGDDAGALDAPDATGDAPTLPAGVCDPSRAEGSISSADCRRYASTPVCDAGLDDDALGTCAPLPTMYCGACETDAQCADGVDLRSHCVFIPHAFPHLNDQACLSPCSTDADCAFLNDTGIWLATARCTDLPRGRYCTVPFSDGVTATCSDFMGGRREDGE